MYYIQKNKETKINSENIHAGKGIIHRKPIFRDVSKLEVEIEEWILEPNVSEGDHTHSDNRPLEEIYYVIEGEGDFVINNEKVHLSSGDSIMVPPNVPHSVENNSDKNLRFIIIWGISK